MPPTEETEAQRQLRLVIKAIAEVSDTTPCFEWEEGPMRTARSRCGGLEPREIKRLAVAHVRKGGAGSVKQKLETDEEWRGKRRFDFWYSVSFDVADVDEPIFLKIVLLCDDEDFPEARIVGAHTSVR